MKSPTAARTVEPTMAPAPYSRRSCWTSARSRAAPRTMSTAGRTIVHTIVAYPTTKLESQRLQTRSVVVHPAIHATPSPRTKARASGQAENQLGRVSSVVMGGERDVCVRPVSIRLVGLGGGNRPSRSSRVHNHRGTEGTEELRKAK